MRIRLLFTLGLVLLLSTLASSNECARYGKKCDGCKNLADAMKLPKAVAKPQASIVSISHPLPPAKGIILFYRPMMISELATMLGQDIFLIIGEVINMGLFKPKNYEATSTETFFAAVASDMPPLDFKTVSVIARKYGFVAQNAVE